MTSAVCSLFEGDYHLGLAALINSLHASGFRGAVYAGYRGPIPTWAIGSPNDCGYLEFTPADGLTVHFVRLSTPIHLTNYKPEFILSTWRDSCPKADAIFYFDPDITIKCRWSFFEEWIKAGVAVCQDVNGWMPDNHPTRFAWKTILGDKAISFQKSFEMYFNGGFLGISRQNQEFIETWRRALSAIEEKGTDLLSYEVGDRVDPFGCRDQDALNIACMATNCAVSPIGQDGMDFQLGGGGFVMSHAIGGVKPWQKRMIISTLIDANPPSRSDKSFMRFIKHPIRVFSPLSRFFRLIDLKIASIIGRFMC